MAYNSEEWGRRVKGRSDLSGFLYHLTKPELDKDGKVIMSPLDRLIKIINERKLIGSSTESGFIVGKRKAVCFQDTPIHSLIQNTEFESDNRKKLGGKIRYVSVGLGFPKPYIFNLGGRPVFYEHRDLAKKILPEDEWWRIVHYDLSNKDNLIDWTHEREWRMPTDEFVFDITKAIVIVPNQQRFKEFIKKVNPNDLDKFQGIIQTSAVAF